ncbi:MAG: hypothetical protein A2Z25_14595 [Planctomycetes bacterium RBG_16_55_9]|nr:MAG: hypothetical protein A2Z25_14595 [Planctomycetes bacterium RBG_16_55_9]
MQDARQAAVEALTAKIASGKRLTEDDVRDTLYLARDQQLLYIARETIIGKTIPDKARIRVFNALQNAVERHELIHRPAEVNPLSEMTAAWQRACVIAQTSTARGTEAN